jgi:Ran GTPase-activating protein 1
MTQNGIRPEGISHLISSGLRHCNNLQVLDMQDNTFTLKGAQALAKTLSGWTGLKELGVGDSLLGGRGAVRVFEALSSGDNESVEILRLQYNDINPTGVKALLQAAKDGLPRLRRVELNGNKFEEEDPSIEALAELLSERKDEHGKDDDPEDHWGLDELDELEGEDSDEEEGGEEYQEEEEEEEARERLVKSDEEAEEEPVAEKKDAEVDELASRLEKTL